ncbi:PREDICTED: uncharacterized protein LOC106807936 [Priapulus caudatus]|uniref:ubiquitinyl hydrolase 1 n=1 Tax=Priapulus caudatus TaxID=37621 RepID=A0ABM1E166_PRICU|nr:PREDICTED: uncharacterized protein LOC106807936 [Priapulus caudatus]
MDYSSHQTHFNVDDYASECDIDSEALKEASTVDAPTEDMFPEDFNGQSSNVMWMGSMFESDRDDMETMPDLDMPNLDLGVSAPYSSPTQDAIFADDSSMLHFYDSEDRAIVPGMCGLRNLGNTCYMNSALQCLLNCSALVKYFLEDFEMDANTKDSLTGHLARLVVSVWKGDKYTITPTEFKNCLGNTFPQFSGCRQHDSQEFLALMLDSLHEDLNLASAKSFMSNHPSSQPDTPPDDGNACCDAAAAVPQDACTYNNCAVERSPATCSAQRQDMEEDSNESSVSVQSSDAQLSLGVTMIDIKSNLLSAVALDSTDRSGGIDPPDATEDKLSGTFPGAIPAVPEVDRNERAGVATLTDAKKLFDVPPPPPGGREKNELAANNAEGILPAGIEEFYRKDVKVANTNVLVTEDARGVTHSDKFARSPGRPAPTPPLTFDNLHGGTYPCTICKMMPCPRVKDVNLHARRSDVVADPRGKPATMMTTTAAELGNAFTANNCKRNRCFDDDDDGDSNGEERVPAALQKRFKNAVRAPPQSSPDRVAVATSDVSCENSEDVGCSSGGGGTTQPSTTDLDAEEADAAWWKHHSKHKSVVVDTFQGQFKSMVRRRSQSEESA